ncbi:MAG: hypothetical protein ACQESR_15695 [Planctomycetota bacterium]
MERCPTPAVLPWVGLAADKVIRDRYSITRWPISVDLTLQTTTVHATEANSWPISRTPRGFQRPDRWTIRPSALDAGSGSPRGTNSIAEQGGEATWIVLALHSSGKQQRAGSGARGNKHGTARPANRGGRYTNSRTIS